MLITSGRNNRVSIEMRLNEIDNRCSKSHDHFQVEVIKIEVLELGTIKTLRRILISDLDQTIRSTNLGIIMRVVIIENLIEINICEP